MNTFNWVTAAQGLESFGGRDKTLHIPKTGLAFFDVLRLYGAIEMYLGLSGKVTITDAGHEWQATGTARDGRLKNATDTGTLLNKGSALSRKKADSILELTGALEGQNTWPLSETRNLSTPLDNPDSALKDGVRNNAARRYSGLATGEGEKCEIAFVDAFLAFAGQERTQSMGGVVFLPIFEGQVDYSRVVSPLRAWSNVPNILCAQVLVLLALKNSLFAEGYADKLSGVVFNTNLDGRKNTNTSGLIAIDSTALGRDRKIAESFYGHCYRVFRALIGRAWNKGKSTGETEDAFAYAYWLMQPERPQHLGSLLTAIERQARDRRGHLLLEFQRGSESRKYAKEIFDMSYNNWSGDHNAVRKLARAVASGIWVARQKKQSSRADQGKAWYDEATMLRSAPTAKAFFERALILIEQGHRENPFIGTAARDEAFDVAALRESIGKDRRAFETFRDLFRMYLIQESTPHLGTASAATDDSPDDSPTEGEEPSEQEGEI